MYLTNHSMNKLFAQHGLASEEADIEAFVASHRPLPGAGAWPTRSSGPKRKRAFCATRSARTPTGPRSSIESHAAQISAGAMLRKNPMSSRCAIAQCSNDGARAAVPASNTPIAVPTQDAFVLALAKANRRVSEKSVV